MSRKSIKSVLVLLIVSLLPFCIFASGDKEASSSGAVKAIVLQVAFNQSDSHPQYKALVEFSDNLQKATEGRYKLDVKPNALLGDQRSTIEMVQDGAIEMALISNSLMENFNKDFSVLGLPYVYDDMDHQKKAFTSGILDELFATTTANGFQVVAAFTSGARSIYTDKPIAVPADLAGYKIRVMQSDTMVKTLNAMGAVGTPMGQGEVYTGIQQGVLEGGENCEVTYSDLKHYEVAPYYSYTMHLMVPDLAIVGNGILDSMSDADRATFLSLCKDMSDREFSLWDEATEVAIQTAIDGGAHFSKVDITPFQNNCLPLHESLVKTPTAKALYNSIRSLSK